MINTMKLSRNHMNRKSRLRKREIKRIVDRTETRCAIYAIIFGIFMSLTSMALVIQNQKIAQTETGFEVCLAGFVFEYE